MLVRKTKPNLSAQSLHNKHTSLHIEPIEPSLRLLKIVSGQETTRSDVSVSTLSITSQKLSFIRSNNRTKP
jgi:hypothetical protein